MMDNYTFTDATPADVPEIIEFCKDNLSPEWRFCAGVPPFPTAETMLAHIEAGDPFVIARRNADGAVFGYRIGLRDEECRPIWGLAHLDLQGEELAEGHAHMTAYLWRAYGEPVSQDVPEADENIAAFLNAANARAIEIYESLE